MENVIEEQSDLVKELQRKIKRLERDNRRLQTECGLLTGLNEQVSRTQQFFHKDNQRQLCYNQQLLKTSPYILVMVNEDFETVMASDVFYKITGLGRDTVREGIKLTEALSGVLLKDELDSFMERCQNVLDSQGKDSYILKTRKDTGERFYQVDICYYLAQNEDTEGLSIMLSDLTEMVEAKERAENADKAKSSFLASMSHEIRTPINAVLGMNEMILRESKDPSILEYASNIQTAGRTLLSLINSILDFSKIEEGKMEIIPVEYDTSSVMNNLVVSISERAKKKGLELKIELDPNLPAAMIGDDIRVSQVIMNLLTNAVKYTEKGSVTFSVQCGERKDGEIILKVSVKDTGIGIKEKDLPKLFESFERLDEVRNHNIEGTGLGMSIVTRLLKMMGSSLSVTSVYGEGSVFSFEIVQKIADETPVGEHLWRPDVTHRTGTETLLAPDSRVMVVDDNDMNLKVAKNLFKLFGITPDLVDSGFEAISKLRAGEKYHVIFLDHMMPKMDGIETLKIIKEENLITGDTPVIALTANAINGAKEQYLEAGFDDYLSKPIEVSKLEHQLIRFLPKEICSFKGAGEETQEEKEDTDSVSKLDATGFDTASGLRYSSGDRDFYLELVADFATGGDRNLPAIRSDYEKQDWADYQIRVHALKSTARQIGANDLSELALQQEMAAKDRDVEVIRQGVDGLLKMYESVCGRIRETLNLSESAGSGQILNESSENDDDEPGSMSLHKLYSILSDAREKVRDYEAESAQEILKPLTELSDESLAALAGSGISGSIKGIYDALGNFEVMLAEEQLDAILKNFSQ